jgi:catechol 2,3-dioxygenase-like lactoylglutathione lyase family enzyme
MQFLSLKPFVPSGPDYEKARDFFVELGFRLVWEAGDYAGLENNNYGFILQRFNNKEFAENFMLSVGVENADAFRAMVLEKQLPQKYGIRIGEAGNQPYGREVNVIDMAGVCWHFVQP